VAGALPFWRYAQPQRKSRCLGLGLPHPGSYGASAFWPWRVRDLTNMAVFYKACAHETLLSAVTKVSLPLLLLAVLASPAPLHVHPQAGSSDAQLIGAPVFAADSIKIGQISDVSTTHDGHIDQIRVRTGSVLGFGERIVAIPLPLS
jgi:hypothetical protein